MNQFKELREKKISKQKRIKDDAMKQAKIQASDSYIIIEQQKKIHGATGERKIQLINEMNSKKRQLIIHSFHCIYNRKYSDTNKYIWPQDKIKLIMDYDFPLK